MIRIGLLQADYKKKTIIISQKKTVVIKLGHNIHEWLDIQYIYNSCIL